MLQLTRSGTTGRLERLTASGLVERVAHPRDGRSALVAVTAEGSRLADELFRAAQDVESVAFASLSDDDRAHLVSSLRRILLELDDTVDGEPGG